MKKQAIKNIRQMGVDLRGIFRGRCRADECDCLDFQIVADTFSCGNCGDPPSRHEATINDTTTTATCSATVATEKPATSSQNHGKSNFMHKPILFSLLIQCL